MKNLRCSTWLLCGWIGTAACLTQSSSIGQNLILNGDFENNGATVSQYNLLNSTFNSLVYNCTAFGTAQEIDLITGDPYGLPPQSGSWKLALHRQYGGIYALNDAFSFNLSSPVIAGQPYTLNFYAQTVLTSTDPGNGPVQIGLSDSPAAFGTLVFSGTPSTDSWTHLTSTFVAPANGLYLTVQVDPTAVPTWNHIDNFSLTAVPEPATWTMLSLGLAALVVSARQKRSLR